MSERSDEIPRRERNTERLLVLFFEGKGGRAVEAMEAKLLARQPDTLDQCLYRVELQRIEIQLAGNVIHHPLIFGSSGIGIFFHVLVAVPFELLDDPTCDQLQFSLAGGEIEERTSEYQRRTGNTHVHFFCTALVELTRVVPELGPADNTVVAEQNLAAMEHVRSATR